jgi:glycosyltransferase involved in cell wall biosynthesis
VDYLVERGARRVTTVLHPLTREDGNRHEITTYEPGRDPRRCVWHLVSSPPYTYPLDLLVPPLLARADYCFAFNNLLCARALIERRANRVGAVAYWAVDFVPDRFGVERVLTRAYDALDAYCVRHADLRIELSRAARDGRNSRHGLVPEVTKCTIAPIGAWLDRVPTTSTENWKSRRVVFIGHLVERMGGETVVQALAILRERGSDVMADVAGRGPLEGQLRAMAERSGLSHAIRFHGFISDHRELERLLAQASLGLAPYDTRTGSLTQYADPSKLKSYLAAGLPILLTAVPPNADELAEEAGAQIVSDSPVSLADAIEATLADAATWERRRAAALRYARRFDWGAIMGRVLAEAGFES